MKENFSGRFFNINLQEIRDNSYDIKTYDSLTVTDGQIIEGDSFNIRIIKFDINGDQETWGGYVKGFLYKDESKFIGKKYYPAESELPFDALNGKFTKTSAGYEIKGMLYENNKESSGFLIQVKMVSSQFPQQNAKEKKARKVKKFSSKKVHVINKNIISDVLNREFIDTIKKKVIAKKNKLNRKKIYPFYDHVISWKPKPNSADDLLIAMSVAYAWMPTMLDIYVKDKKELGALVSPIQNLGKIKSIKSFDAQHAVIKNYILKLASAINNSTVGTSKVLHIFFPNDLPIIDRNVLKGWNVILKRHFKKYPELKLPINIPAEPSNQVDVYLKYWRLLLLVKQSTGIKNIREIEEPLYWLGINN